MNTNKSTEEYGDGDDKSNGDVEIFKRSWWLYIINTIYKIKFYTIELYSLYIIIVLLRFLSL